MLTAAAVAGAVVGAGVGILINAVVSLLGRSLQAGLVVS